MSEDRPSPKKKQVSVAAWNVGKRVLQKQQMAIQKIPLASLRGH
jgi:hypothetical protein